jgi:hypothetical protein
MRLAVAPLYLHVFDMAYLSVERALLRGVASFAGLLGAPNDFFEQSQSESVEIRNRRLR